MAGRAGRTYKRDGNGRFASTGTSGKKSRPPAKTVAKGVNKLTRDNAGKITSVGGDGATARGGRLRTASGNLRATQTTRIAGGRAGMVGKGGKLKGSKVLPTTRLTDSSRLPASQRPGSMTNTLRGLMGSLAKQDAKYIREVEGITGQKVRATKSNVGTAASNRVKATAAGSKSVSQTLRAGLRELTQSDARTMRGMAEIVRNSTPKLPGGKGLSARGKVRPAANPKPAQLPAATGRRKPLKGVGEVVKRNLTGFAGMPVEIRSRKQAAAAQRERARRLIEGGRSAPGADGSMDRTASMRIKYNTSRQANLFGGIDKVKSGKRFEHSNTSKIGKSSQAKRSEQRRSRVNARLSGLNTQRDKTISGMSGRDFSPFSQATKNLKKIEKSMDTARRADDFYDSNPKIAARRTARKRK